MPKSIKEIINSISDSNNIYRDPRSSNIQKIVALWEMGDKLSQLGVKKPHQMGWAIQKETRGLIKRPTVFRSYKIRSIWESKNLLINDLGKIRTISNLTEIFPLVDPMQPVRSQLSKEELSNIYSHASNDTPAVFKKYVTNLKSKYSHGSLGRALDKSKHLKQFGDVIQNIRSLIKELHQVINSTDIKIRDSFRDGVSKEDLLAFSNMCISLTTKENIRFYKKLGTTESKSTNLNFKYLYDYFYKILDKKADEERARLRRLVSAEALAQISDMVSSLSSEESVVDYRARQKMVINL